MYKFYNNPMSQHARRVRALLEDAKLPHQLINVGFEDGEYLSDEYLAVNPNHQVPTLIDGDIKIHESNAILRYLCFKHELDDWYPLVLEKRATVEQWLDWGQCRLAFAVMNIVLYTVFMPELNNQEAIKSGHEMMKELTPILSAGLEGKKFLTGDKPTIADLAIASNITQLSFANAVPQSKNIIDWYDRVCSMPAVRVTLPKMKTV